MHDEFDAARFAARRQAEALVTGREPAAADPLRRRERALALGAVSTGLTVAGLTLLRSAGKG